MAAAASAATVRRGSCPGWAGASGSSIGMACWYWPAQTSDEPASMSAESRRPGSWVSVSARSASACVQVASPVSAACAAASVSRRAMSSSSSVSAAERSSAVAAASAPWRRAVSPAPRSSWVASSGSRRPGGSASARCQARRSGRPASAAAIAWCTTARSSGRARWYTAERIRGWLNSTPRGDVVTRPASSAARQAPGVRRSGSAAMTPASSSLLVEAAMSSVSRATAGSRSSSSARRSIVSGEQGSGRSAGHRAGLPGSPPATVRA